MKDLIIIGGLAPDSVDIDIHSYRTVIAADSGYDTALRLGIRPDVIVGDFDSTSLRAELIGKGYNPCPADKDETDAELAIMHSSEYDLIGGGEGRIDHTLSLFTVFRRYTPPSIWYMRSDTVVTLSGHVDIEAPLGTELSFFSPEGTSMLSEVAIEKYSQALTLMGQMAELKVSIMRLSREVKKTIRKVNALEKLVIPDKEETVKYLIGRIEEAERENFILLKSVKDRMERDTQKEA